jgi:hypothetical protein
MHLFFFDSLILFILGPPLEALPGQHAFQEVDKNVSNRLDVISSRLLNPQMSIHRCVPCRASELLFVLVWNVLTGFWVSESFCKPEINHVHYMLRSFRW